LILWPEVWSILVLNADCCVLLPFWWTMNKWLIPARSLNNSFISLQARHLRKLSSDAMGWGFVLNVVYVLRQTILFHLFLSCLCSLSCETSVLPHLGSICCFEWSFKHNFNIYLLSQFKNHFCFLSVALSLPRIPRILWSFPSCGNLRLVFFSEGRGPPCFYSKHRSRSRIHTSYSPKQLMFITTLTNNTTKTQPNSNTY
jgi:hypothetical protein